MIRLRESFLVKHALSSNLSNGTEDAKQRRPQNASNIAHFCDFFLNAFSNKNESVFYMCCKTFFSPAVLTSPQGV